MIHVTPRSSRRTVIVFSGMAPLNHVYEWTQSFADLPVNLIGVRDPDNKWYQTVFADLLPMLRTAVADLGTDYLVCLGASAGGFAALAFGPALRADRILAFCPQSACGQAKRDLDDRRWPEMCAATPSADIAGEYPTAEIHYSADDGLDTMHAWRAVAPVVHAWPEGGHDLPFALKRNGVVRGILEGVVR